MSSDNPGYAPSGSQRAGRYGTTRDVDDQRTRRALASESMQLDAEARAGERNLRAGGRDNASKSYPNMAPAPGSPEKSYQPRNPISDVDVDQRNWRKDAVRSPYANRPLNYISDPPRRSNAYSEAITLQRMNTREALQRDREIKEAEEDLASWKERKSQNRRQREQEQREDLRQLQEYQPWGKPGAGAPHRFDDGKAHTQLPSAERVSRLQRPLGEEPASEMSLNMDSKRGGGGEPGRTSSGRVRTRLQQHPETRFQEHATNDLLPASCRAAKSPASTQSELHSRSRRNIDVLETVDESKEATFFPFGRPGCGAPLKTGSGTVRATLQSSGLDDAQREHVEQRRREALRYRDQLDEQAGAKRDRSTTSQSGGPGHHGDYDPWGKGIGNMPRDSAGFIKVPPKQRDPIDTAMSTDKVSTVADALKRQQTEMEVDTKRTSSRHYNPDEVLANQEKQIYLQSMRDAAEVRRSERLRDKHLSHAPGNSSTADWVQSMNVGRPKRDPFTDKLVTGDRKPVSDLFANGSEDAISPRRTKNPEKVELHAKLCEQAELRQRAKREDRAREKEEVEKHMDAIDGMFGKPGCGAPLRDDRGRVQAGRLKSNELAVESYKTDTTTVRL